MSVESVRVGAFEVRVLSGLEDAALILMPGREASARFALAVNPEKVMMAHRDPELATRLAAADFCYPDGIGVVWAMRRKGARGTVRVPGAELWLEILRRCSDIGAPAFLLGAGEEALQATIEKLGVEIPGLKIVGARNGYFREDERSDVIREIASSGARFVSVALGSPRQEDFIREALGKTRNALFMGVGGSYDVYIGKVKRAPAAWRRLGLEWLYRLLSQPSRWRRQSVLLRFVASVLRNDL